MKSARLHFHPEFPDLIARTGLSLLTFARQTGVGFSTIMGLVHSASHPGRRGDMQRHTAWRIAQAYAAITSMESEDAFHLLFVEYPVEQTLESGTPS